MATAPLSSVPLRPFRCSNGAILNISELGLGTVKFGRNRGVKYPEHFELPSDDQILRLLSTASRAGIHLIDTAPAYGESEQRLGQLLPRTEAPSSWILSTKVGETFDAQTGDSHFNFSPDSIQRSIERSLKSLNRSVLDFVLVHSDGNDIRIIEEDRVFETLRPYQRSGSIRAIGMSVKTQQGAELALQHSDGVMIEINLRKQSFLPWIQNLAPSAGNKFVFIKKVLQSGWIREPAEVHASMRLSLDCSAVTSIILGTLNPERLLQNVRLSRTSY